MYDYGARFYMPDIGRWTTLDALSELQFKYSPYSYVYNNPIRYVDPTGMIGEEGGKCPPDCPKGVTEIKVLPNGEKESTIQEVKLVGVSKIKQQDASLSWMGINSLSAYHASEDRLAAGIRGSKAALATEKFERNLAFTMGTFLMGGSNLAASAGWAAFDWWADYQSPEDQKAIQVVQAAAIISQIKHGNVSAVSKLINIGKQGKHILGHNNYTLGKSILTEDAQVLLDAFHSGDIKSAQIINDVKTRVDFGKVIGEFVKDGVSSPTTNGIIHNGKNGAHIVPSAP